MHAQSCFHSNRHTWQEHVRTTRVHYMIGLMCLRHAQNILMSGLHIGGRELWLSTEREGYGLRGCKCRLAGRRFVSAVRLGRQPVDLSMCAPVRTCPKSTQNSASNIHISGILSLQHCFWSGRSRTLCVMMSLMEVDLHISVILGRLDSYSKGVLLLARVIEWLSGRGVTGKCCRTREASSTHCFG